MSDPADIVFAITATVHNFTSDRIEIDIARKDLRKLLQALVNMPTDTSQSFADIFTTIATNKENISSPELAATTVLLVSTTDLLPATVPSNSARHVLRIIDQGDPRILSNHDIDRNSQTYEQYIALRRIHLSACEHLSPLAQQFTALHDLSGRRQILMRSLNQGSIRPYLNPLGFQEVRTCVSSLLTLTEKTIDSPDNLLQTNLQNLSETLEEDLDTFRNIETFIVQDYCLPFLMSLELATKAFRDNMAERFECAISPPPSSYEVEKKYPLYRPDASIELHVPLMNVGPGTAQNVRAYCIADNCDVLSDDTHLGAIEPGAFILPIVAQVTEPADSLEFHIVIDWDAIGDHASQSIDFSLKIFSQRTDLDWAALGALQPYSLEVAYDTDFYGRHEALDRILHRLDPASMQSCYITGQKRVGKSSLAHAVAARVSDGSCESVYSVLYLECGEIRHATGGETMEEFGRRIDSFVLDLLPDDVAWKEQKYFSSLIPLGRLFRLLAREQPKARVLIIFDEFDEINEELYRYGELANTFFLNMRMLASQKNLAFLLVGAERMPYVMSAQGEKLNKFARESLNSFDLTNEWSDYRALIENPLRDVVTIYEEAMRRLFDYTSGHPYFTKVICSAVFERSVRFRDAEVSATEITKAAERVITSLDINAFAHYWRDGIRGGAEEVEIISINRCRTLVAWARVARIGRPTSRENLVENLFSGLLPAGDVPPLLDDFVRRDVLQLQDNAYFTTVKLFGDWLTEGGFSRLISDQLGDELAQAKQLREDEAYVQASEVAELVERWDLYQGRQITSDDVREWLGQVESNEDRRLLFKVLQNVRFVRDPEVREKWAHAHRRIRDKLPPFTRRSLAEQREDIMITYADGPGKSGAYYAGLYAAVNEISTQRVVEPSLVTSSLEGAEEGSIRGVVVVDDMLGTGQNLVDKLMLRVEQFGAAGIGTSIPLLVVVLNGTSDGEERVRSYLERELPNAELEVCELLGPNCFAFGPSLGFWGSEEEKQRARSLIMELGSQVHRRRPLGYGDQGLLLTFARNCPDNTLPILHSRGRGERRWRPIFPRTKR